MSKFDVFVHYHGTEVYVVEAENKKEARAKALKRWDDGEDGDTPGTQDVEVVDVEKAE